jgi:hypothetical protein
MRAISSPRRWSMSTMATPLPAMSAIPKSPRAFGKTPKTKSPDSTAQRAKL